MIFLYVLAAVIFVCFSATVRPVDKCTINTKLAANYDECFTKVTKGQKVTDQTAYKRVISDTEALHNIAICVFTKDGIINEENTVFRLDKAKEHVRTYSNDTKVQRELEAALVKCAPPEKKTDNKAKVACIIDSLETICT